MKALITLRENHLNYCTSPSFVVDEAIFNELHGAGNWVCLDEASLPADFSCASYTIEGGALAAASLGLIAIREAAALVGCPRRRATWLLG